MGFAQLAAAGVQADVEKFFPIVVQGGKVGVFRKGHEPASQIFIPEFMGAEHQRGCKVSAVHA